MNQGSGVRNLVREIEREVRPVISRIEVTTKSIRSTTWKQARRVLKRTKSNLRTIRNELQKKAEKETKQMRPRMKRAMAATIRKTIGEPEMIEDRLD